MKKKMEKPMVELLTALNDTQTAEISKQTEKSMV